MQPYYQLTIKRTFIAKKNTITPTEVEPSLAPSTCLHLTNPSTRLLSQTITSDTHLRE